MNKDIIIKLLTGGIAKGIRYGLTAWGSVEVAQSQDWAKLEGALTIFVALVWSFWEDWIKRKQQPKPIPGITETP
jgi:hypothetical protein